MREKRKRLMGWDKDNLINGKVEGKQMNKQTTATTSKSSKGQVEAQREKKKKSLLPTNEQCSATFWEAGSQCTYWLFGRTDIFDIFVVRSPPFHSSFLPFIAEGGIIGYGICLGQFRSAALPSSFPPSVYGLWGVWRESRYCASTPQQ